MTSSSEARVPHDPQDLREAAGILDRAGLNLYLARRLEAWADDLEAEEKMGPAVANRRTGDS